MCLSLFFMSNIIAINARIANDKRAIFSISDFTETPNESKGLEIINPVKLMLCRIKKNAINIDKIIKSFFILNLAKVYEAKTSVFPCID